MSDVRGKFVWYDLVTPDMEAAEAFYKAVVGWSSMPWEGREKPYTMWTIGETSIGGVMTLPEEAKAMGAPPHWLGFVCTPDVAADTEKARAAGSTVYTDAQQIPDVGAFSVLSDPQGVVVAFFTPKGEMPAIPEGEWNGKFSWHELVTGDWNAALEFYSGIFEWKMTDSMDMGEMGTYAMFGHDEEQTYGGMMNMPPGVEAPPHWLFYCTVPDLDAALAKVKELGGQIFNGPMEVPDGSRVAQCCDPQGAAFALHGPGA